MNEDKNKIKLKYYSETEIDGAIQEGKKIVLNDEIVLAMKGGKLNNYMLRDGLCEKDASKFDFTNLSKDMLIYLSFTEQTKFPDYLQEYANNLLENSKRIMNDIEELHKEGITGKKRKVAIVDTKFDYDSINLKEHYETKENLQMENHGIKVASIVENIVPDADIIFIANDKSRL